MKTSPAVKTSPRLPAEVLEISRIASTVLDARMALEQMLPILRSMMIFDNFTVYTTNPVSHHLDVLFARAMGRGKAMQDDLSWGETIAARIIDQPRVYLDYPVEVGKSDRLRLPYTLGIPLYAADHPTGVLTFIRFGGPEYTGHEVELAGFIAQQVGLVVERQNLYQINDSLNSQSQEMRLQDDFVSTITHELRTPLGFIKGYCTTLLRQDTHWNERDQREFLTIIDQETDRLGELIENMLDSARLQSGNLPMDLNAVRMDTLIQDAADRVNQHHPGFCTTLHFPQDLKPIQADAHRLAQVFEYLFLNAVKYAPGSPVDVSIEQRDGQCLITIQDHGSGIAQRYLPHLFDRFFRNPESSFQAHGVGLGLHICRKIIQAHQGTIEVSSTVGEGTTFFIRLPVN